MNIDFVFVVDLFEALGATVAIVAVVVTMAWQDSQAAKKKRGK